MLNSKLISIFVVCLVSFNLAAQAEEKKEEKKEIKFPAITNWPAIEKSLKLADYKGKKMNKKIRIAILDNGFNGYTTEVGKLLPANVQFTASKPSEADSRPNDSLHGAFMAILVNQIIVRSGITADYEMKLFNTWGYTKFADAVEKVIEEKFDVVLYAQVWEFGSNGDGKGFINTLVNKATSAGIIWINAAGNFGIHTRTTAIDSKVEGDSEWVLFKNKKGNIEKGAKFFCKAKKCEVKVTLSWNSFKDSVGEGTDKDLDLYLYDSKGNEVAHGKSILRQKLAFNEDDPAEAMSSLYPREFIEEVCVVLKEGKKCVPFELTTGQYWARVKVVSKNFSASQDKLRLTFSGGGVELADSDRDETLLPPGDNSSVIVIGAADDYQTNRSVSRKLPEVLFRSAVELKGGLVPMSTSTAAAMAAGLTVINLGLDTEKTKDAVTAKLKSIAGKNAKIPEIPSTPPKKKESPGIPIVDASNSKREIPPSAPRSNRRAQQPGQPQQQPGMPQQGQYPQGQQQPGPQGYPQQQPSCLPMQQLPQPYQTANQLMATGRAWSVFYNGWTFILVDPNVVPQIMQVQNGMRMFMTPQGMITISHQDVVRRGIPRHFYELLPAPLYTVCQ